MRTKTPQNTRAYKKASRHDTVIEALSKTIRTIKQQYGKKDPKTKNSCVIRNDSTGNYKT